MVTVEDLKDYFFIVSQHPKDWEQTIVSVQANHIDNRKFSYSKNFSTNDIKTNGIEQAKAITLCELIEEINKEEEFRHV